MKPDPLTTALSWFDAYRAGALSALLRTFDKTATVECACGGTKIITGDTAIAEYWKGRLLKAPAGELQDVQSSDHNVFIHYTIVGGELMSAAVEMNKTGRITYFHCTPVLTS